MKLLRTIACLLACSAGLAHADTVNILGLPLGKTFNTPIPQCAANEASADAKTLCWAGPPNLLDGGTRSGAVSVPDVDKQASWTAQGKYVAFVTRDDKLTAFTVHTAKADDFAEIARFFTKRFGAPMHPSGPGVQTMSAYWRAKYAQIELSCPSGKGCDTSVVFTDWNELTQRNLERLRSTETPTAATPTRR
jgi:hypothetical protein